jgi:radical SAM protein with 4Fe4S-binding SPASM domain
MPTVVVKRLISEAADMGFKGYLNLQFFNEPLMDNRIAEFGRYAKAKGCFELVRFFSNADLLDEERARELDGAFDQLEIALYDSVGGASLVNGRAEREAEIRSWFKVTRIVFTGGSHVITHFSPLPGLSDAIARARPLPCTFDVQERLIISHTGEMLLCCDDINHLWNLGNIYDHTLSELWYSDKHQEIINTLSQPGGRMAYEYCRSCPRTT